MHDIIPMQEIKSENDVSHNPLDIWLVELFFILETSFKLKLVEIPTHNFAELGIVNDQD